LGRLTYITDYLQLWILSRHAHRVCHGRFTVYLQAAFIMIGMMADHDMKPKPGMGILPNGCDQSDDVDAWMPGSDAFCYPIALTEAYFRKIGSTKRSARLDAAIKFVNQPALHRVY